MQNTTCAAATITLYITNVHVANNSYTVLLPSATSNSLIVLSNFTGHYYTIMCIIFIIITILTFIIMAYDQLIFYYGNYCAVDHTVAIYPTEKP